MSVVSEVSEVPTASSVSETAVDLTTVVQQLEWLEGQLRAPRRLRIPAEVSAACDALACAAVLLRARQQDGADDRAEPMVLLHDAMALARSTVEATKYACRARTGQPRTGQQGAQGAA
ncbi:hypothetical protein ACIO3O_29285 [Streptomyces sp. NPDC087440]|uniref:hypothetical protein n=1 Tax=Streptomyces sp. NPDC087440 TaxID=3365790 RepID=UPI0037FFF879